MPPEQTPGAAGVPAGTRVVLAPGTRRLAPGLLSGGSPWRLLYLTGAGDRWVDRWGVGQVVPDRAGARHLAGRLVDAGLAWSRPPPDREAPVVVVVPCRDRAAGLAATLGALEPDLDVIVVDDGSAAPAETRRVVAGRPRTRLIARAESGGPGTARNDGWRLAAGGPIGTADTCRSGRPRGGEPRLIAFLDTDCIPAPGWVADLAGHFRDPGVGAVAPRIGVGAPHLGAPRLGAPHLGAPRRGAGRLQAYEEARSPLDLGPLPAPVRPRSTVPYVPSAALVVRLSALADLGGFDEQLVTGEDVDLAWRLDRAGWRVRYDPSVVVAHPVRPDLRSWLRQRAGYGRSAAPLASRHGAAVAPLAISRWSAAAWVLAGLRHPVAGAAVAMASTARMAGRAAPATTAPTEWPRTEIARLVLRGHVLAGRGSADALRRAWWPLAVVAAVPWGRVRPALLAVAVLPPLLEWRRLRPGLGPATWVALRLADDLAYGTGVWSGVWRERSAACLAPDLS